MITTITNLLQQHPEYGMIFAFSLALIESLPFIGSFFPGMLTMPIIGWLMASHRIPPFTTFTLIIIGAMIGDYIGFFLGVFCKDIVKKLAERYRITEWFTTGELFVEKYGPMSIVIGRFFGPFRSSVPLFAGIFDMNRFHFSLAALPSVTLWAIVHLAPGMIVYWFNYDIVAHFHQLMHIDLWVTAGVTTLFLGTLLSIFFINENSSWNVFHVHMNQYCRFLKIPEKEALSLQKILHLIIAISCMLFLITHETLKPINVFIYSLLSGQSAWLIQLSLFYNALCYIPFILLLSVICCVHFIRKNHAHSGLKILLSTGIAFTACFIIKYTAYYPRPSHVAAFLGNQSLPSGHTCLTTALVLALAAHYQNNALKSTRAFNFATICIVLTMTIRVLIGAHWLSDVFVGWLLGYTAYLISDISLKQRQLQKFTKTLIALIQPSGDIIVLSTSKLLLCYAMTAMAYAAVMNQLSIIPYML